MPLPLKCDLCKIECPSQYQMDQHLAGAKHKSRLSGGGASQTNATIGFCFAFARGSCSKGAQCKFRHNVSGTFDPARTPSMIVATPASTEAPIATPSVLRAAQVTQSN